MRFLAFWVTLLIVGIKYIVRAFTQLIVYVVKRIKK
jgi:hypothetical protein